MKKITAVIVLVVLVGLYVVYQAFSSAPATAPVATDGTSAASESVAPSPAGASPTPATTSPAPAPTPVATTPALKPGYRDGTYTSATEDAYYGPLQIKVTIAKGKISNITFLQYPTHDDSYRINQHAMPILTQEAIKNQTANVSIVSGATQTSEAFQQAVTDVFTQAKA